MLKSRPRLKKIGLLVVLLFIVLQVHSFWAFRYRFENYFYDKVFSEEFEDNIWLQMEQPIFLAHKPPFATLKYLFQYSYNKTPEGMEKISNRELYHLLRGNVQRFKGSIQSTSHGYSQITFENCPSLSVTNQCHRVYTIYDNVVCSFSSKFEVFPRKINCRIFYRQNEDIYSLYPEEDDLRKVYFVRQKFIY